MTRNGGQSLVQSLAGLGRPGESHLAVSGRCMTRAGRVWICHGLKVALGAFRQIAGRPDDQESPPISSCRHDLWRSL